MTNLSELIANARELTAHGAMGTRVSEYIESKVPRQCGTCEYVSGKRKHLCNEEHVARDPEMKSAAGIGFKIVDPVLGCCRYWEPKK